MKKFIIFIYIVAVATGCSKSFLDKRSLTQLGEASFWKTEQDAVLGVNGIYEVLQDRVLFSGNLNGTAGLPMYDTFGDNAYNSFKFEGPGNFMSANIDPSNAFFSSLWVSLYKGIARANNALENMDKIPTTAMSDSSRKALRGQALFLRSLFYMHLAMYFEDAPLILKVQTLAESYVPKNTYQQLSTQIVNDLKEAITLLPVRYSAAQYGYATRGAALGMLARFQLYNKDHQGVMDATTTLLTMGYALNPNYSQLFTEAGEFSNEILFSVRFSQDASNNGELFSGTFLAAPKVDQQPMPNLVRDYYCTDGRPITTSPLYSAANPKNNRDPRLTASVYFRNDIFITDLNRAFTGNTATGFGLKKYIRTAASAAGIGVFNPGGQDFIVLRYADVLLMRAEAMVELNQLAGAYALVNQVRARVGMPTVQAVEGSALTQAAFRDVIRHERRVELAFEGLRFYDLKRWGAVQAAFQRVAVDNIAGYGATFRGTRSEIFPIPLSELNANSQLTQHPAW
jgi:hypothetical protein